ncbi:predicted protein [Chaetomium globosum CBS 148.51]|uniref:Uncharacterized protein n=1 Tax=Chaetomium globosum (strain ATCC 6205 / CBS 148.51 / DSM 1962 / NBRC 6347 / NRRL 1970) TaxID=306901 RepID=Q2HEY5_CHAGB|nr:uncharacterized protein CHGG_01219 [Chaetomium globosum CBS 148.51]EAQ92984.1 predicted protein [Chaetomium globosum CBS 148.51]
MAKTVNNVTPPTKESEQPRATTVTAAAAVDVGSNTTTGVTSRRQVCEGAYFCDCCLCICGASVEYPGDVCCVCSKYH